MRYSIAPFRRSDQRPVHCPIVDTNMITITEMKSNSMFIPTTRLIVPVSLFSAREERILRPTEQIAASSADPSTFESPDDLISSLNDANAQSVPELIIIIISMYYEYCLANNFVM